MSEESYEEIGKKFILEEDMKHENLKELIGRIMEFAKVDSKGYVLIIDSKKLRIVDKIMIVLITRYLANKLQKELQKKISIKEEVSIKEFEDMLKEKKAVIAARLKDLRKDKKIIDIKKGLYKVSPYSVEEYIEYLETKWKKK